MTDFGSDDNGIADVIGDLYAGTLDDEVWSRAMLAIADSVRASGALLFAFEPQSGAILRFEHHRFDSHALTEYQTHWTFEDIRRHSFLGVPTGTPMTDGMLLTDLRQWRRTAIFNEFLIPADCPNFMPAWLHKVPGKFVALSFQGTRKRGPFDTKDIETYRRIAPHISRAVEIRDRLERTQIRADTLGLHLNTLSFGVAVLDSSGRLLETNAAVQELLRVDSGIRCGADGTLHLRDPAGAQLARWILARAPPPDTSANGLLHVQRLGALPLSVMLTPLPVQTISWLGRDPRWLLLIFDPERRIQASIEIVAKDLGVSAREAEVAALLVAGCNLRKVARRLAVSEHTVRCQLKSIFAKTGTHSQPDLIRRIALGPAVISDHQSFGADDRNSPR